MSMSVEPSLYCSNVAPTLGINGYGNFEITANTWTYTLNNSHLAVQALDAGETLNVSFTFTASHGSAQVLTITINGVEDAPVIGGIATGTGPKTVHWRRPIP